MEEKINELRKRLIERLKELEEGSHIKLDYDPRLLEMVLFKKTISGKGQYKQFALPKEALEKIDFSNVNFDDFYATNFDFTGLHGIKLNPQTIYDKNLNCSILNGVTFIGPFDNVSIQCTDFTGSTGAYINPTKLYFKDEYDENKINMTNCKFNGVTFTSPIKILNLGYVRHYCYYSSYLSKSVALPNIKGSDFTGSRNAIIYMDYMNKYEMSLVGCTLTDTTIIGEVSCNIGNTDFSGSRGQNILGIETKVPINPQKLPNKSMQNCKFDGIKFTGLFDEAIIAGSDFTGSTNATIELNRIDKEHNYDDVNFTDTTVIGYSNEEMTISSDGKLGTNLESMIDKLLGIEHESEMFTKKELEATRKRLLEANRKKVQEKISELLRLVETTERLGVEPRHLYSSIPISREELFVTIDDHYEINRNFVEYLRFLNLSMIDFDNVKVSGLDFRHSGARINPQLVYKKDLSNGIFDAGNIKFYDDLNGVNIEGADFSECEVDPKEKKK